MSNSNTPDNPRARTLRTPIELHESNAQIWKTCLINILEANGLADTISHDEKKFISTSSQQRAGAIVILQNSISPSDIGYIADHVNDPRGALAELMENYLGGCSININSLELEINQARLPDNPTEANVKELVDLFTRTNRAIGSLDSDAAFSEQALARKL